VHSRFEDLSSAPDCFAFILSFPAYIFIVVLFQKTHGLDKFFRSVPTTAGTIPDVEPDHAASASVAATPTIFAAASATPMLETKPSITAVLRPSKVAKAEASPTEIPTRRLPIVIDLCDDDGESDDIVRICIHKYAHFAPASS
jgi:hypothetical protein